MLYSLLLCVRLWKLISKCCFKKLGSYSTGHYCFCVHTLGLPGCKPEALKRWELMWGPRNFPWRCQTLSRHLSPQWGLNSWAKKLYWVEWRSWVGGKEDHGQRQQTGIRPLKQWVKIKRLGLLMSWVGGRMPAPVYCDKVSKTSTLGINCPIRPCGTRYDSI